MLAIGSPATRAYASPAREPARGPTGEQSLFSRQGIDKYLLSHGVNPRTAVEQTGPLNYVGDACPGKRWHCLAPTQAPVVQVASVGGVNVYHCSVRPGSSGGCFVLQVNAGASAGGAKAARATTGGATTGGATTGGATTGRATTGRATMTGSAAASPPPGTNQYTCQQTTGGNTAILDASGCAVNQVNTTGVNQGTVQQQTRQDSAATQTASETAGVSAQPITQANVSGTNQITIQQQSQQNRSDTPTAAQATAVSQTNRTGQNQATIQQQVHQQVNDRAARQDQEASQFACLTQDSPGGQNQAIVDQRMNQSEQDSARGATQYQNENYRDGVANSTCGRGDTEVFDYPNVAAVVLQDENTTAPRGQNQETLDQALQERQRSTAGSGRVTQQQGSSASDASYGGLDAIPNQNSTGVSQANTRQDERQVIYAGRAEASQSQYDPIRQPPGGIQESNRHDRFQLSQDSIQQARRAARQIYTLDGDCTTSGACDVGQAATSHRRTRCRTCTRSACSNELTDNRRR